MAESQMFMWCSSLLQGHQFDPFRMCHLLAERVQEGDLSLELDPLVESGMHRKHVKLPPSIDVLDGVQAIRGFVVEELTLVLDPPVSTGGLQDRGPEPVGALQPHQGDHASHRHAPDGHPIEIEALSAEGGDHVVDL